MTFSTGMHRIEDEERVDFFFLVHTWMGEPFNAEPGMASFHLKEVNHNHSLIEYQAEAMITGALAKLSPRLVEGVAQTLINLGLANLNRQLQAAREKPLHDKLTIV